MPFDKQAIFDSQLQHLADMASRPGWKKYAWCRAKELASSEPGLFPGIDKALTQRMTGGQASAGESDPRSPEKQP